MFKLILLFCTLLGLHSHGVDELRSGMSYKEAASAVTTTLDYQFLHLVTLPCPEGERVIVKGSYDGGGYFIVFVADKLTKIVIAPKRDWANPDKKLDFEEALQWVTREKSVEPARLLAIGKEANDEGRKIRARSPSNFPAVSPIPADVTKKLEEQAKKEKEEQRQELAEFDGSRVRLGAERSDVDALFPGAEQAERTSELGVVAISYRRKEHVAGEGLIVTVVYISSVAAAVNTHTEKDVIKPLVQEPR